MTLSVINAPLLTEPVAKQTIHVGPPPVAIDASFTCKVVGPLTVRFTDTSTGEVTSRHWTAGDGNYTITSDPFWVYTYSQPGNYITTFRASGPGGDAPKVIHAITVPPPPIDPPVAEFSFKPTDGRAPLTVQFTDESTGAKTWLWTFGDGSTSTVQNPSHRFADPDTYAVSLTVSNGAGSDTATKTLEVEPTETPTPAQAYPPTLILYPTVSGFMVTVGGTSAAGTAGTAITRIGWDWGDGTTGDHAVPDTHAYAGTGSYTITVTAYQSDGQSTTRSVTVFVSVPTTTSPPTTTTPPVNAPIAAFTWSPDATDARLRRFTDTSTGPVTAWRWEFGDGTISTERNPAHVYPGEGTYRVLLTATGPGGASTAVRDLLVGGTETPYVTPTATPTTVPPTATVVPVTPTPDVGDGGDGFPLWLVAIAAVGLLAGGVAVAARAVRPPSPPGKPAVPVLTIEPHGSLRRLDAGDRSIDGRAIEIEVRGGIRREQDSTGSAGAVRPGGALERDR